MLKPATKHWGLLVSMLLFTQLTVAQSGWTLKKGEYFAKVFTSYGASDEYFNLDGNSISTSEFSQFNIGFYGEYGLTDKITLLTHGPLLRSQSFETTDAVTALGDLPIGFKYQVFDGKFPVTVGAIVDIPLAKADNFTSDNVQDINRANLPAGDGEWNYRFTVAASHSFYPAPVYVSAYTTYNLRTEYEGTSFSDQVITGFEGGVSIKEKLWLIAALETQNSIGDAEFADFVRGEGTEFTSLRFTANYSITDKWGVDLTFFTYTDWINDRVNLYNANVYTLGISYQLKK